MHTHVINTFLNLPGLGFELPSQPGGLDCLNHQAMESAPKVAI